MRGFNQMLPPVISAVLGSRPITVLQSTLLPQPDSPTTARMGVSHQSNATAPSLLLYLISDMNNGYLRYVEKYFPHF